MKRVPDVVRALNNEVTRLTGKKPAVAIKEKSGVAKPSTPYSRPVGVNEKKLPPLIHVRYLYQPGELEGGTKRATDPIWSLKVYQVVKNMTKPNEPVVYYLTGPSAALFVKSCWLCRLILSCRPCETRSAVCEFHLVAPTVCHNRRSALACAARKSSYGSQPCGIHGFLLYQCHR